MIKISFPKKRIYFLAFFFLGLAFIFGTKTQAASYNFQPANPVIDGECTSTMDIYADVTGEDSNAADLEVTYNTSQITVLDADPMLPGVQIIPGNAYELFFANDVDTGTGTIRIGAASFITTLTTNALFATIQFKSNPGILATTFHITFTGVGDTLDSNIAETTTSNDLLTSTTDGTPTFITSSCSTNLDNNPPAVNFIAPVNNQNNVSVTQPIVISLTDDYSGVNITTFSMSVDGNVYNYGSPYINVTGTPNNYTVTFNPPIAWSYGSGHNVQVSVEDNTGKLGLGSIYFTTEPAPPTPPPVIPPPVIPPPANPPPGPVSVPIEPPISPPPVDNVIPPEIIFVNPKDGQTNVPPDTNIIIQISEGEYPIDFGTVTFNINGTIITSSDPRVQVVNNKGKYIFTINPSGSFSPGQNVVVIVSGKDLLENDFSSTGRFSITTPLEMFLKDLLGKDGFPQFRGTFFGNIINTIGITGILSGLSLLLLILALLINSSNIIGNIFGIIALLLNKRKRPWGVILDSKTQKPVSFATVRLVVENTLEVIAQTVSALDGTYGFNISEGKYTLEVRHPQYKIFKTSIEIQKDEEGYVLDIELASILGDGVSRPKFKDKLKASFLSFYNKFRDAFFIFGFLFAVLSILISPSIWNWIIFGIFLLIIFFNVILEYKSRSLFSDVEDAQTGKKVPFAIVKIYELISYKNIDTRVCDSRGNFDYYGEPGEYGVVVASKGYKFPSKTQTNLPIITDMYSGMVRTNLTKGKNKLRLFLDPDESVLVQVNQGERASIQSPFG
ncbi:MAG: Ig-like domain-containing domain [Candidatus Dojkabacteria bacterium]